MASKKKSADPMGKVPKLPKMPPMPSPSGAPKKKKRPPSQDLAQAPPGPLMGEFDGEGGPGMGMGMMGPTTEEKLGEWLATKVFPKNIQGIYYQLRQKSIDGETVAHEWATEEVEGQDPDSIAAMVYGQAVEDSQGSSGVTSYAVHAMRPSDGMSFSRCFFRLAQEDMTQGFDSEPGHLPEGHMAQAHRHSEVFARMLVGQTENVMRHYRDQNKELSQTASRAIQLQVQVAEMFQRIQDRGMMRDVMLRRVERKERMKEKIVDYAMSFLPDVLSKVGIIPGQLKEAVSSAQSLDSILAGMSDEKMQLVSMALENDEQRAVFTKAFISAKQRAAAAQARAATEAARKQARETGQPPQLHLVQAVANGGQAPAQSQIQPTQALAVQEPTQAVTAADAKLMRFLMDMTDDAFDAVAKSGQFSADEVKSIRKMRVQTAEAKAKAATTPPAE